jgi:hypothetical protein
MTQEISYRIRFTFPEVEEERERMLPSIDLFLRAFENADRLMAGALGLELDYRRALKEMGESSFFFHITLTLRWPRQILLGAWPDPADLRSWMDLARNDLFRLAGTPADIGGIAGRWDDWARAEGLADSLVYTAPPAEKLSPVLADLGRAVDTLGGGNSVELD